MALQVRIKHAQGTRAVALPARPADRPVVIGRSASADVKVPSFTPGEDHCAVFVQNGKWHVVDLYAAGQVLVNGAAADEPTPVRAGDVVTIGDGADAPTVEVGAVTQPAAKSAPAAKGAGAAGPAAARPAAAAPPPLPPPQAYAPPAAEADPDAIDFGAAAPADQPSIPYARRRPKKKSAAGPLVLGLSLAVVVAGGVALFLTRSKKPATPAVATGPAANPAPAATPAAVTPPSSTPEAPPPAPVDATTPLAAYRAYAAAMEAGKPSGLKRTTAGDGGRYAVAEGLMYHSFAVRQLEDAAVKRYGAAGRGTGTIAGPLLTEAAADPNLAETVRTDAATVGRAGAPERVPFVRAAGAWRFDLNVAFPDPAAARPALKYFGAASVALARITEDVASGKVPSVGDAKARVRAAIAEVRGTYPTEAAAADAVVYYVGGPPRPAAGGSPGLGGSSVTETVPPPPPRDPMPATGSGEAPPPAEEKPRGIVVVGPEPGPREDRVEGLDDPKKLRVVFVCDYASPALAPVLPTLVSELENTVRALSRRQSFQVLVGAPRGRPPLVSGPAAVPAEPAAKDAAAAFIKGLKSAGAGAQTDLAAALDLAAAQQPTLLYLFVGPDRADVPALDKQIARLNAGQRFKVNTILFSIPGTKGAVDEDALAKALRTVAEDNGGRFTMVREEPVK